MSRSYGAGARHTIVVASNTAWSIANFRLGLARHLMQHGYDVLALSPPDEHVPAILAAGVRFVPVAMDRTGTNPLRDAGLVRRIHAVLQAERPLAYLGFTIKPNVYGGLACRWLGIPSIHNVTGLGFAFARKSPVTSIARGLYRIGLGAAAMTFFQNEDDRALAQRLGLVDASRTRVLPGSGVDTTHFAPRPSLPRADERFTFLFCGRVLRDKGIVELVQAARQLRQAGRSVRFQVLGALGDANPTAVAHSEFEAWLQEGVLEYLGTTNDVRGAMAAADCVVLPSYHEGMPRSLLEAAAMGKPVITTDVPGCRDAIESGVTGLLSRVRDADDLARQLQRMLDMPQAERAAMGAAARQRAVRQFDEQLVLTQYLDVIAGATATTKAGPCVARAASR